MVAESRRLQAGPVSTDLVEGALRHIRVGAAEAVERVYFALRDVEWGTVPGQIQNLSIREEAGGFQVSFDCLHKQGEIDFVWQAEIRGEARGAVSFALSGEARSRFLSNRISLCVHHPLSACAGKPCRIEKAGGGWEDARWPDLISPHQPFFDIRSMEHEFAPGAAVRIRFEGGVFETEDQRNWSDNNFKTYSPPLELPFPVEWKPGDRIRQRIEIEVSGDLDRLPPEPTGPVVIRRLDLPAVLLPPIGLCLPQQGDPLPDAVVARLRRLNLSHLRAEFSSERAAELACREAERIGVPLEAVVTLPGPISNLRRFAPQVARWLVHSPGQLVTAGEALRAAREQLGPAAVLGAGSNKYFAELNRDRLPGLQPDGAYYPVHPQVHACDDETVMNNVRTQRHVLRTARSFAGGAALWVTPITLGPRTQPDPRQQLPFCAVWTAGSLKHLAESGAASVTYFETHGPHGVQEEADAFPVFDLLERVGEFAGGQVIPTEGCGPGHAEPLLLAKNGRRRLLLANLAPTPAEVVLEVCGGRRIELPAYGLESIDWVE
ncbi:MAG: hypothetical protein K6T61_00115 [Bryobacteraceae bacterium]|nr:hypothetical protein [Bryobacteraceae bacterium]